MKVVVAFLLGALFAVGLVVSGMTRPDNVVAFLDITGAWDPALAVVMVGAIGTYLPVWLWARRREAPVFDIAFHWPTLVGIDARLVGGAALFGVGWGLSGFCPGPGFVAAGAGVSSALWFTAGTLGGFAAYQVASLRSAGAAVDAVVEPVGTTAPLQGAPCG